MRFLKNIICLINFILIMLFNGILWNIFLLRIFNNNLNQKQKIKTKLAKKIVITLPKFGPAFVKLGQFLSTRHDLAGEIFSAELKNLCDNIKPEKFSVIKRILENEYKNKVSEIFEYIGEEPTASASLAQLHKVKTKKGQILALKILRPNIGKRFQQNLNLLRFFVSFLNIIFGSKIKRLRIEDSIKTIEKVSQIELNMMYEASASVKLKNNALEYNLIYIPEVFWEYTNTQILASEWIDGIPFTNLELIRKKKKDMHKIAEKIAISFCNQAYNQGFFHADLHLGNIILDNKNRIVLVDFGAVSFLPEKDRLAIAEILYAFIKTHYKRVSELHFYANYVSKDYSPEMFELACRSIAEPILNKKSEEISMSRFLRRLFAITEDFGMETQTQLIMLQKNMVMLEGILLMINPELNLWTLLEPWFEEWAKKNLSPKAKINRVSKNLARIIVKNIHNSELWNLKLY